ncbi:spermidine/putrescine ABC transporter permease/substrate-binding protein [Spiroplasma turonicum]|uniref:Spermidine/putrescine ABC transporter permease n=1 Tax=Spiroplasma turonicum TaxID=216946 RepID=A0A0K1P4Y6_9MOLU|nr:spermidine/putrescine ABC transporter permease/substrate-binding protein [Spiroplasma turonicum]AKU79371.1 spermidine/putrescine ABC transporter permease [Spiroplasma turonicum]ALX70393.1 spermidine/putrescine ABC transporter permease [Spiroplasma turonicum]
MKKFIKSCYFLIMMLFIYVPIATMIFLSFNSGKNVDDFTGFSFRWYKYLIEYSPFIKSLTVSLFVAMISTVISIIIGVMACYGLSRIKRKVANRWVRVANIPLVNADVITAVSLMIIFVLAGIKFGIVTLIAAHISFNVPYVIVTVLPFMNRIDKNVIDASNDLGGNQRQTFFKVILPILLPSIITATAICFAMSFDDFIISYFTGGDQTNVSTFIYTAKKITPYINAFGTILVITIVLIVLIWNAVQITSQSIKENKLKLKNGTYKLKELSNIKKQIKYYEKCVETNSEICTSLNPFLWIKYKFLQLQYKTLSNKTLNAKISRLEWKKELLVEKINDDSRTLAILSKLENKKTVLKTKNESKKIPNLDVILLSLDKKISKYQEKVELINQRKLETENKIKELENDIKILKEDLSNEKNPNDKTINWYNTKILSISEEVNILKEGKNKYKLKQTIDKLNQLKSQQEEKMLKKYDELQVWKRKVKRVVPFSNVNGTIVNESKISKYEKLITSSQMKLDNLLFRISKKKDKLFPVVNTETVVSKNNVWIKRNWKKIVMSTSVLAAFSLLTTAYALNNVYDLIIGNWGSYIAPNVIENFEKQEGVKLNYQQFDSNESLYNKTYTFNYDVMVPSEYMIKKLAEEDKLQKLNYNCIKKINKPDLTKPIYDDEDGTFKGYKPVDKGVCQYESIENKDYTDDKGKKSYDMDPTLVNILDKTKIGDDNESILDYSINWFWGDVSMAFNIGSDEEVPNENLIKFLDEKGLFNKNKSDNRFKWNIDNSKLSWNILWEAADRGFDLKLNEDPKNVFMYAFEKLYGTVDLNGKFKDAEGNLKGLTSSEKQERIDTAAIEVEKLLAHNNVGLYGDQIMDRVHAKEYDIAVLYNGDLLWATAPDYTSEDDENDESLSEEEAGSEEESTEEKNDWVYTTLKSTPHLEHNEDGTAFTEGTNVWSDSLVLSNTNRNLELTYKFINYMYDYEIQRLQVEEATATSIIKDLNEEISNPDGDYGAPWDKWYNPSSNPEDQPFGFDKNWDNYLVDKFNQIISTKH